VQGLACGFWLPPADNISLKGYTGHHSDTMRYVGECISCHSRESSVLGVRFLLMSPPVGDIWYPQCIANLHWVAVIIIEIWNNLPPVLRWIQQGIRIEPGGDQQACCAIAFPGCRSTHIDWQYVLFIIAGQITWLKGRLIGSSCGCQGEVLVEQYAFSFNDQHISMFRKESILHILQKCLLVVSCIWSLILEINTHSHLPYPKWSTLKEQMKGIWVWWISCHVPHCRDWHTLGVFPLADTTSAWYQGSKMYC